MIDLRQAILRTAILAAVLSYLCEHSLAQTWPIRPVRIVVGVAAGSPQDILSRLLAQWLSERLGQPFVIENRPGAGTNVATEAVARAPADGYTLLSISTSAAINATLYKSLKFNFLADIAPVAIIVHQAQVLAVNPSIAVKTLSELIAFARANPGKLNYASGGVGSGPHLASELFKSMAKVDIVHVPYNGVGPATAGLVAGDVQMMFFAPVLAVEYAKAGAVRALAVTTKTRHETLPDTPTMDEELPGYESSVWFGIGAPARTPVEIVNLLNQEINAGLRDVGLKSRLAGLGGGVVTYAPSEFRAFIATESAKWAHVIRISGATAD